MLPEHRFPGSTAYSSLQWQTPFPPRLTGLQNPCQAENALRGNMYAGEGQMARQKWSLLRADHLASISHMYIADGLALSNSAQ